MFSSFESALPWIKLGVKVVTLIVTEAKLINGGAPVIETVLDGVEKATALASAV